MSLDKLPGVAEVAMQSGLYAGRRIRHRIEGNGDRPVPLPRPRVGRVPLPRPRGRLGGPAASSPGSSGWLTWLFIHIAFLTGYRNRAGAILTWAAAFARDARRERTFTTQQIERLRDVYDTPPGKDRPTDGP